MHVFAASTNRVTFFSFFGPTFIWQEMMKIWKAKAWSISGVFTAHWF